MSEYLSNEEELDQIKEWWHENGRFIVVGVVLGLIGIFAWRGYNAHLDSQAESASQVYDKLVAAITAKNQEEVDKNLNTLVSDFSGTAYSAQAQLLAAREAANKGDLDKTATALESAITLSKDADLTTLANFRLAKVRFAQGQPDAALNVLKKVSSENYKGIVEELRGDIYASQDKKSEARAAYEAARTAMEETKVGDPNLLQMKLSDLGT